jgi:type IV secretory pathway TraG/TraD family ATPase VirD4
LAPLLLAAHGGGRTLAQIGAWIDTGERDEPELLLRGSKDPDAPRALEVLGSLWLKDHRYASSVFATLEAAVDPWLEPSMAGATAEPDITADGLLGGANTLYVVGDGQGQRRLASLFGAVVMAVIDGAFTIANQRPDRTLERALLCALDEVANIAPIPALGRYASAGLAPGVVLLSVLQDHSQAVEHWGQERAQSILANHTAKLFLSGISDPPTLRYITDLLGHERVKQQTTHRGRERSTTTGEHLEPLAPPHLIRQSKADTGS